MAGNDDEMGVRLQKVALALFLERGYDRTTAAEIARSAGVTERTFFRYFPDKREVLFGGEAILREFLLASIAAAPAGLGALDTLFHAFRSTRELLENNRPFSEPRHRIIAATPVLYERELAKTAALSEALATALQARGVDHLKAVLAARSSMAAFVHAVVSWLDDANADLGRSMDIAFTGLKAMLAHGA